MDGMSDKLELMIDAHGLTSVLASLAVVCHEKADHIRSNWQDNLTAKQWEKAANRIDRVQVNGL